MRKLVIFALSLLGIFDSSYLLWAYTSPSHRMVCGVGHGCDAVRASAFAQAWGIPLPALGLAMYLAIAVLVFAEPWLGSLSRLLVLISGAGFLASLYLTSLEAFVIHAWCAWCVVSAITVTAIFILALFGRRRQLSSDEPAEIRLAGGEKRFSRAMIIVLIAAVLIGIPSFWYLSLHGETPTRAEALKPNTGADLVRRDSHATGNLRSPVSVVEFADFQCPACKADRGAVDAARESYGDRVRFVFRQFPLREMHPMAEKAAEASECAAEQDKFWEMQEILLSESDLKEPALIRYATRLGLDKGRFTHCLESGATAQRVERDLADAHAFGFRGTPTFVIGQQVHVGPMTQNELASAIDRELAEHGMATGPRNPQPGQPATAAATSARAANSQAGTADAQPGAGVSPSGSTTSSGSSGSNPLESSGGTLGGNTADAFAQLGGPQGCSEDEARKRQPALIRTDEARQLFQGSPAAVFVDVRPAHDFAAGHIRGSIDIPSDQMAERWNELPKDKAIVLYENGKGSGDNICAASRAAGRILLQHGYAFDQVKVYQDGLAGWQNAGLPLDGPK